MNQFATYAMERSGPWRARWISESGRALISSPIAQWRNKKCISGSDNEIHRHDIEWINIGKDEISRRELIICSMMSMTSISYCRFSFVKEFMQSSNTKMGKLNVKIPDISKSGLDITLAKNNQLLPETFWNTCWIDLFDNFGFVYFKISSSNG